MVWGEKAGTGQGTEFESWARLSPGNELASESATLGAECYVGITVMLKDREFRRPACSTEHDSGPRNCWRCSTYDLHLKLTKASYCRNNSPVLLDSFGSRYVFCEDPQLSISFCVLVPGSGPAVMGAGTNRTRSGSADGTNSGAASGRETAQRADDPGRCAGQTVPS